MPPLITSFSFTDTPPTDIYTLSLHDALPICRSSSVGLPMECGMPASRPMAKIQPSEFTAPRSASHNDILPFTSPTKSGRSEEHTSELQSRLHLVCRLLLEKKK